MKGQEKLYAMSAICACLANATYFLIFICLINLLLALYITREILANKEIISSAITFISFQGSHEFFIVVMAKNTISDKRLYFFEPWIRDKLQTR